MNPILYCLCKHSLCLIDSDIPLSTQTISILTKISFNRTRNRLYRLKLKGLVERKSVSVSKNEWDVLCPVRGWMITEKARKTKEFQNAYEDEMQLRRDVFWNDMFPKEG